MQHWTKCILVLTWKMVIVGAQCPPGFNCSDVTPCYLIYPGSNGLEYQEAHGDTWAFDDTRLVYPSPNCYKYIPMNGAKSCNDTQRECEKLGGNITVIDSIEEKDALSVLVHHIILFQSVQLDTKFKVFNQEVDIGITKGCTTFTIKNYISKFELYMENTDCFTTHQIDAIICESSDVNIAKICPKPGISTYKPDEPYKPYKPYVPNKPYKPNKPSYKSKLKSKSIRKIAAAVVSPLLCCMACCARCRKKKTNRGNGTHVVGYQVACEDVNGTALTGVVAQNNDPTSANEVVYRDAEIEYDDTAAAKGVVWLKRPA